VLACALSRDNRLPAEIERGAILEEARRVCEARGVRFLVLAIPSVCQVRPSVALSCGAQDNATNAALIHLCAAAGIDVVEPLDELRAAEAGGPGVLAVRCVVDLLLED
jgi:hypothetical protein